MKIIFNFLNLLLLLQSIKIAKKSICFCQLIECLKSWHNGLKIACKQSLLVKKNRVNFYWVQSIRFHSLFVPNKLFENVINLTKSNELVITFWIHQIDEDIECRKQCRKCNPYRKNFIFDWVYSYLYIYMKYITLNPLSFYQFIWILINRRVVKTKSIFCLILS